MYFNSVLTRLETSLNVDSMGYTNAAHSLPAIEDSFPCDAQPFDKAAAQKEYGLEESSVRFRCFLPPSAVFAVGEAVSLSIESGVFKVILSRRWENHVELILGV